MRAKLFGLLSLLLGSTHAVLAAQNDIESALPGAIVTVVFAGPLPYAGNKWRTWYLGFRRGAARGGRFISALLWTVGALVWIVVGMLALFHEGTR